MTLKELSQICYLDRRIKQEEDRLEFLRLRLTNISPKLSGMPGRPGASDRLGENIPEIVDLTRKIEEMKLDFETEKAALELRIRNIEDIHIKLIFLLRFVDLKSWKEIAVELGRNDTIYSASQLCYRYMKNV